MDPHFTEYLAAIVGMHETYGDRPDESPTEFHADTGVDTALGVAAAA